MSERNIENIAARLGDSSLGMGYGLIRCPMQRHNDVMVLGCWLTVLDRSQGQTEHRDGTARQHRPALQRTIIFDISQKAGPGVCKIAGRPAGLHEHIMGAGTVAAIGQPQVLQC